MGNKSSLMLQPEEIAEIHQETGFSPSQIERLYSRFTSLDKTDNGTLSREDFLRIPELAINPLGDRIVHAFFNEAYDDRINFRQFMRVLSRFRPVKRNKENKLNSREEKLRFAFKMYDLDDDNKISRDELLAVLHMMVGANISEEQDCLKKWRVSSDKSNREGNSTCSLEINDKGKGVFYGNLDTTPPKDGKNRFAGYCAIKTLPKMKSFLREDAYDWLMFTHLEMRVKGDGRNYAVHLGIAAYFDVSWFDMYTYTLHTHGGPYWQVIRIPFSKFYLTSKGRIQDKQCAIPLYSVNTVCILAAGVPGPFRLEIDYIGCHVDLRHKEKFAYEMYKLPKEYVSS